MLVVRIRPTVEIDVQEKMVFMSFFLGAIVCMGLSFTFHTVCCHSNKFIGQIITRVLCFLHSRYRYSAGL
jgi:adiponectin receptor